MLINKVAARCSPTGVLRLVLLLVIAGAAGCDGGSAADAQQSASAAGSAVLSWTAPTTYTNGSALTGLAGYTITYGTSPSALTQSVTVSSASANSYTVSGLAAGTWYFSVAANANDGAQSAPTAPVSLTIS
jgi:Fibronectin type III domain